MKDYLLQQFKKRRQELGLKQKDMMLRVGISRQQYQHLETKGNPRLDTLTLVAKGLNSELMLIPREKLIEVQTILKNTSSLQSPKKHRENKKNLSDDPWQDLLEDEK